jgi:hypothetical protein
VLGLKNAEQLAAEGLTCIPEPHHYVCQPCFEKGIKSVLQKYEFYGAVSMECTVCKERFYVGKA